MSLLQKPKTSYTARRNGQFTDDQKHQMKI